MPPEAYVFDAYGTLYDVHSVIARCETLWPGQGARLSQLWRARQLEYTWLRSLMRRYAPFSQVTRDALAYACGALELPLDRPKGDVLMQAYQNLALFPDVRGAMERLRGRRKAILSNGSPDMLDPLVANSGLQLDAVLSVDRAKIFKPAPEVYQLAVDALKLPKENIGFVSSNCWDAIGAKSFGFRTFWICRSSISLDVLGVSPDAILGSLEELPI